MTKEELREYKREYYLANRDKIIKRVREHARKNAESISISRKIKYRADPRKKSS